jgi:hypothetical protein
MQRETATLIAGSATQSDMRLLRHERQLATTLMSLLPDDATAAGTPIEDPPGVWAIAGNSLYLIEIGEYVVPPVNDSATEITCRRRAIDPATARVSVRERVGSRQGGGIVRERRWEFVLAEAEEPIVIETEEVIRGGFAADGTVPAEEELARAFARAAGFAVPADDVGAAEY